ncbi:MAG: serine/threonine-protein kinase, partial [Prevotellaceae bacterium]|nr:serine/threonine-protein kinase [Prevotellaceae bacterium]
MISLTEIKDSHTLFDNHYQLIEKIGGGGFSEVWLAHDTVAGIDVALKVYTPNGELDEEGKNDFKREFARLCDINHSNIIHAIGFGIYRDELPYLVMNICKNGSAKKLICKIDEEGLWNFMEQVASGLQYLHKRGIVHQDMKPDNVLINSDGQYLIIDFGISTKIRSTLRRSVKGSVGGGTPWYMSIESFGKEASSVYARDI